MKKIFPFLILVAGLFMSCEPKNEPGYDPYVGKTLRTSDARMYLLDSIGWEWSQNILTEFDKASFQVSTDPIRLHFYGWSHEEDSVFTVNFPAATEQYGRAIVEYTMCGWKQGPAEWDMTTMIKIEDKETGEWYEFTRCITPYGGKFDSSWNKKFYIDVTEFLPLMKNQTRFKIFYCGWDATDTRAHAVQLTYYFFECKNPYGTPTFHQKIYDSTLNGNTGYRSWAYGVEGHSIEDAERLGERTITLPAGTDHAVIRVSMTGHGQDGLTGHQGTYPDRPDYKGVSAAEFDKIYYTVNLDGKALDEKGLLWERNGKKVGNQYEQAGTCWYDRCNWGPGKPCNIHHWMLQNIDKKGQTVTLDLDLDRYVSTNTAPNAESVAQFYVEVDVFGYAK